MKCPSHLRRTSPVMVVACVLVQLVAVVHLLLAPHVRCSEHGEMAHVHHDEVTRHESYAASDDHAQLTSGLVGEEGHDHCEVFSEPRDHRGGPTHFEVPDQYGDASRTAPTHHVVTTNIPVHRYAPKLSPPSFAI